MYPYLTSMSLYWASRLRLLLFSWRCLPINSSSSASCLCCRAVSLSWSRLKASRRITDSSFSFSHTLDSASRAAQRSSLSLQRASTDAWSELRVACSTWGKSNDLMKERGQWNVNNECEKPVSFRVKRCNWNPPTITLIQIWTNVSLENILPFSSASRVHFQTSNPHSIMLLPVVWCWGPVIYCSFLAARWNGAAGYPTAPWAERSLTETESAEPTICLVHAAARHSGIQADA